MISVDENLTENIVAKEMHVDGKKIEGKIKVDNLPVSKKIFEEEASVKEIRINATKKVKKLQVDEQKLREFLSRKELTVCHLRCIIVGCTGAGKTTLLKRLGNLTFEKLKSIESTEIGDVHANFFEVLEDEETIQSKLSNLDVIFYLSDYIIFYIGSLKMIYFNLRLTCTKINKF